MIEKIFDLFVLISNAAVWIISLFTGNQFYMIVSSFVFVIMAIIEARNDVLKAIEKLEAPNDRT